MTTNVVAGLRLNLGCGYAREEGFVNVDRFAACAPDQIVDLDRFPWPWATDSVEAALFNHSLEHMGATTEAFLGLMGELYRVCRNGAVVIIRAPHPRHDDFLNDPTHVRAITPDMLALFDRSKNDAARTIGAANTPLAHYLGVDFEITRIEVGLDPDYQARFDAGELSEQQLRDEIRHRNNVAREFAIALRVRKSSGN